MISRDIKQWMDHKGEAFLKDIGIGIKINDGHLVVAEGEKGVIYRHRGVLKASGFRFDSETKQWTRPLH